MLKINMYFVNCYFSLSNKKEKTDLIEIIEPDNRKVYSGFYK